MKSQKNENLLTQLQIDAVLETIVNLKNGETSAKDFVRDIQKRIVLKNGQSNVIKDLKKEKSKK